MKHSESSGDREAGLFGIGPERLPRVVLADNAWFDGFFRGHRGFFEELFGSEERVEFSALRERLDYFKEAKSCSTKLEGDLDLLRRLANHCEGRYQLCLCALGFLRTRFLGELDRRENAVLVSLGHSPEGESRALTFDGPNYLMETLGGRRPRAELVFITGHADKLQDFFEAQWRDLEAQSMAPEALSQHKAHWWAIRSLPIIKKYDPVHQDYTLESHLKGFFDFFGQRFQRTVRSELLEALAKAQSFNPAACDPAHIQRIEELGFWEARHGPFPLASIFLDGRAPAAAVESFKALFSTQPEAGYQLHGGVMAALLRRAGYELRGDLDVSCLLPTQPGAVFCYGLLRFLEELREATLTLEWTVHSGRCHLRIPIQRPEVFLAALSTRNFGGAVSAFRDWLGGNTEPLVAETPSVERLLAPWIGLRRICVEWHHPVWSPVFDFRTYEDGLELEWKNG